MFRIFGKTATMFVGFGIFAIWFIMHFWYVTLPIIAIAIICYVLICKSNKKEKQTSNYNKSYDYFEEKQQQHRQDYERKKQETRDRFRKEWEERNSQEKFHNEQQEKIYFEESEKRVKERLEKFNLTEAEALLVFGKNWRKRLGKPDYEFVTEEIDRIIYKFNETDNYIPKISSVMEKVLDMLEYCGRWYGKHEYGWDDDDLHFEDWEEDVAEVKETWNRIKWQYQNDTRSNNKRRYQRRYDSKSYDRYYEILGVSKNATVDEIKKQYRQLIMKFHPDKNKSPEAEKKCQEIIEAYENLVNV